MQRQRQRQRHIYAHRKRAHVSHHCSTRAGWTCLLRRRKHADRSSPHLHGRHGTARKSGHRTFIVSAPVRAALLLTSSPGLFLCSPDPLFPCSELDFSLSMQGSSLRMLGSSSPRLRGELTLGDEAPSRCPFVSAPTWAAPNGKIYQSAERDAPRAYVGGTLADQHPRP